MNSGSKIVILASRLQRIIAFGLDVILIALLSGTILVKFIQPHYFPEAFRQMHFEILALSNSEALNIEAITNLTLKPQYQTMTEFTSIFTFLMFWAYFFLSEYFMNGSSLGKCVFRLRTIDITTLETPSTLLCFLRAGTKTLSLLVLFPFLLVNYLIFFFTKNNRAVHDLLNSTIVIHE